MLAGLAVAGLLLPEAAAYAAIAGLPPRAGLTAAIIGGLVYLIVGRSRLAIVSPTSSAAAILAASLASLQTNVAGYTGAAAVLTALVGLIFITLSLAQIGVITGFISRPVLRGFGFALGLTIIVGQLPHMTGIDTGYGSVWHTLSQLWSQIGATNIASLATGVATLGLFLSLRRFRSIPAGLTVLLAGIMASSFLGLRELGVEMAPAVDFALSWRQGLQGQLSAIPELARMAVPIALILFAESWGTMRTLAIRHGEQLQASREVAALGLANLASGAMQGMPVGAGFSAGSANEAAGARSRLAGATACFVLVLVLMLAPGAVSLIPAPVLSAVVIAALLHSLSIAPFEQLKRLRRDYPLAIAAALGVLVFGVLNGMLFAIGLSLADLLHRLARPVISELGRQQPHSHNFVDLNAHKEAQRIVGLAIYRPNAPLIFANAESVLGQVGEAALAANTEVVVLSLEETDDLDSTAIEALLELEVILQRNGIELVLARLHDRAREGLRNAGSKLAEEGSFSVMDAVSGARSRLQALSS
ncbi:SulP family inorganic anion transporter [Qipengyuania zhejiangensis]|uniref:SulP family inorganic anion transporter n=1 Tax=Qipengyuania zhejiangensis TaxID=3077782 RepID=UPI002D799BE4|nr:SulP family inorganic anion transporter [Qipengyuania sp. Z2]